MNIKTPKTIYLQVEDRYGDSLEIENGMTWCRERINETDAAYVLESEHDALRENLNGLRAMIAEQVKLTARYKRELNALRDKYGELPPGESPWCYPATERDALREKLKAAEQEAGCLRLNQTAYDLGMKEIIRDQDRLRARFKAAEGLAEALEAERRYFAAGISSAFNGWPRRFGSRSMLGRYSNLVEVKKKQALAAWKAAND